MKNKTLPSCKVSSRYMTATKSSTSRSERVIKPVRWWERWYIVFCKWCQCFVQCCRGENDSREDQWKQEGLFNPHEHRDLYLRPDPGRILHHQRQVSSETCASYLNILTAFIYLGRLPMLTRQSWSPQSWRWKARLLWSQLGITKSRGMLTKRCWPPTGEKYFIHFLSSHKVL